jgi:hypothetical protein
VRQFYLQTQVLDVQIVALPLRTSSAGSGVPTCSCPATPGVGITRNAVDGEAIVPTRGPICWRGSVCAAAKSVGRITDSTARRTHRLIFNPLVMDELIGYFFRLSMLTPKRPAFQEK